MLPAIALIAGGACGLSWSLSAAVPAAMLVPAVCVGWTAWLRRRERTTMAATLLAFFCAGGALTTDAAREVLTSSQLPLQDPVAVRARLVEDASPQAGFTPVEARVTAVSRDGRWQPARTGVMFTVGGSVGPDRAAAWRAGREIETFATFRRPARYLDEGVRDFERDLALAGTALFGSIKSGLLVDVRGPGTHVQEAAAVIRTHVRRRVRRWVAPHDELSAAIVTAILIGDRTGLPDEVRLRLQAAGTYHVIAISGGNIAILAGLMLGVLSACGAGSRPAACTTLLALIAYSQIVSAGASVWRATLMAVLYLGARIIDHRAAPWQALAVAAAIVVCARPLDVRDAGFLLTFGATAALLEGGRLIQPLMSRRRAIGWLLASVAASLAVEIALLPVSAWTFSRVTGAGLVLNLAAVPLMALVQISGLVVSCAPEVDFVARSAGWMAHASAAGLIDSARLIDVAPWLTARVPPPSLVLVMTYYLGLGTALAGTGARRLCGVVTVMLSTIAIVTGQPAGWLADTGAQGRLRLTMFDVGQGDATLLELPDRSRLLVDAGGTPFGGSTFDVGARVLAPALWARGLRRLNTLLITHGDPDHIGGASAVIDDFGPSELWEGVPVDRHRALQDVLGKASGAGARLRRRKAGETWWTGGARIRVLHPPPPDWERQRVRNDDSVVLEIVYGDMAILLLGDVGAGVERSIMLQLTPAPHRILKVGHHGSRTSTSQELLDRWRPQIALISCGRENTFGHPAPEVLRRLGSVGARIYRTDLDGQVTIETDGRDLSINTYVRRRDVPFVIQRSSHAATRLPSPAASHPGENGLWR